MRLSVCEYSLQQACSEGRRAPGALTRLYWPACARCLLLRLPPTRVQSARLPACPAADEHASIREWVAYHHSIGVARIYLYDDGSTPPLWGVLDDFIQSGVLAFFVYLKMNCE